MQPREGLTLKVANIPPFLTQDEFSRLFMQLPGVQDCQLTKGPTNELIGYVDFGDKQAAGSARAMYNGWQGWGNPGLAIDFVGYGGGPARAGNKRGRDLTAGLSGRWRVRPSGTARHGAPTCSEARDAGPGPRDLLPVQRDLGPGRRDDMHAGPIPHRAGGEYRGRADVDYPVGGGRDVAPRMHDAGDRYDRRDVDYRPRDDFRGGGAPLQAPLDRDMGRREYERADMGPPQAGYVGRHVDDLREDPRRRDLGMARQEEMDAPMRGPEYGAARSHPGGLAPLAHPVDRSPRMGGGSGAYAGDLHRRPGPREDAYGGGGGYAGGDAPYGGAGRDPGYGPAGGGGPSHSSLGFAAGMGAAEANPSRTAPLQGPTRGSGSLPRGSDLGPENPSMNPNALAGGGFDAAGSGQQFVESIGLVLGSLSANGGLGMAGQGGDQHFNEGIGDRGGPQLGQGMMPNGLDGPPMERMGGPHHEMAPNGIGPMDAPMNELAPPARMEELPPEACPTLFLDHLPHDISKREVAHIFRPFEGFTLVRMIYKDSPKIPGTKLALGFVEFTSTYFATQALRTLQGYPLDLDLETGPVLVIKQRGQRGQRGQGGRRYGGPNAQGGAPAKGP
ncbi:hypothetical protein WJX72_009217 [[Myrmecia] bisecta]|uniref:RRM domain-containing protein n=1 Tax=[Myrmecia] bisecta TaxID=41462 RepID=A0AAW1QS54_9CHLO